MERLFLWAHVYTHVEIWGQPSEVRWFSFYIIWFLETEFRSLAWKTNVFPKIFLFLNQVDFSVLLIPVYTVLAVLVRLWPGLGRRSCRADGAAVLELLSSWREFSTGLVLVRVSAVAASSNPVLWLECASHSHQSDALPPLEPASGSSALWYNTHQSPFSYMAWDLECSQSKSSLCTPGALRDSAVWAAWSFLL